MIKSSLFARIFATTTVVISLLFATMYMLAVPFTQATVERMEESAGRTILNNVYDTVANNHRYLENYRQSVIAERKAQLRSIVLVVEARTKMLDAQVRSKKISWEQARQTLLDELRLIKYGRNDYVFASDYASVLISHPDPKLHNADFSSKRDSRGNLIVPPMVEGALKTGDGYYSYWWRRLGEQEPTEKLSYYKHVPEFQLVIGTGVYLDDVESAVQLARGEAIKDLREQLRKTHLGKTGYVYIFDGKMNMIIHPNATIENKNLKDMLEPVTRQPILPMLMAAADKPQSVHYKWDSPTDPGNYIYEKISWVRYFKDSDIYLASSIYVDELTETARTVRNRVMGVFAVTLLLSIFLIYQAVKKLTTPLRQLSDTALRVKGGDLDARCDIDRQDEIGVVATALNGALEAQQQLVESLQASERLLEERVEQRTAELSESNRSLDIARTEAIQSMTTLQSILDTAPVGIYLLDANARHTKINKTYMQITGCSEEELLGHTVQRFFPSIEEFEAFTERVAKALLAGKTFSEELQLKHKNGELRWILCHVDTVIPNDINGGIVVAVEDISDRISAEQEIKETNQRLKDTLQDLRETQTQLIHSEKMASLGQLVANVAHEINTPIGAVKSSGKNIADALDQALEGLPVLFQMLDEPGRALFMKLIRRQERPTEALSTREERVVIRRTTQQLEEANIPNAREKAGTLVQLHASSDMTDYLPLLRHQESDFILETARSIASIIGSSHNINTAVERVSKIIFALKSFSRIDSSGEMLDAQLQEGIETVLTIYQNQIKQGVEVVRNFEEIPPLRCLPDELNQVWTNLIHNALQSMNYKGILSISIRRENNEAIVSVGDTGSGIPEDIRSRIFDAFFTTKPTGEGSGLGLDIVKKIVNKHQGRIEVQSEVGVGTTFSIHLPYAPES